MKSNLVFFWRCVLAEFISSTSYCYIASSCTLTFYQKNKNNPQRLQWEDSAELLNVAITMGLSVAAISFIFNIQHGGYINPAVTFAQFASWRNSFLKTFLYLLVQFGGG